MAPDETDVIVIGGGPAGLMACAAAAEAGARVVLVEKGNRLGRKLIISGGGRCNVTNNKPPDALISEIPGNGRFLYDALHRFGPPEIIRFFEGLGVRLKEEDHGRMFPVTDKATTVAETLIRHIRYYGVSIRLGSTVAELLLEAGRVRGVRLAEGGTLRARAVVIASGGRSVPATGSTGDGYPWARAAGHTVTELFPTEVPLTSDEPWVRDKSLMGLSLRDVALTLLDAKGKKLTTQRGDMLFTHFGVSGPAALRLGHYVSVARKKTPGAPLTLQIDMRPDEPLERVQDQLKRLVTAEPKKAVKNVLKSALPERLVPLLLEAVGIDGEITQAHLPKAAIPELARLTKQFPLRVTGTRSLEEAFVTGGGVKLKEVDPKTMASRCTEGLYFAGEVLDVHAHTGGYNITVAFSTGHAAGSAAAAYARPR